MQTESGRHLTQRNRLAGCQAGLGGRERCLLGGRTPLALHSAGGAQPPPCMGTPALLREGTAERGWSSTCPLGVCFPKSSIAESSQARCGGITWGPPQLWPRAGSQAAAAFPSIKWASWSSQQLPAGFPATNDRAEPFDVPDERQPRLPGWPRTGVPIQKSRRHPPTASPGLWEVGPTGQPQRSASPLGPAPVRGAGSGQEGPLSKKQLLGPSSD